MEQLKLRPFKTAANEPFQQPVKGWCIRQISRNVAH